MIGGQWILKTADFKRNRCRGFSLSAGDKGNSLYHDQTRFKSAAKGSSRSTAMRITCASLELEKGRLVSNLIEKIFF